MSVHNAAVPRSPSRGETRASIAARRRTLDRLFLGGCTAIYVVLIGAVILALRFYGT